MTNYQIVEEEDTNGFTRISILVDPILGRVSKEGVKEVFFREIERVTRTTPQVWRQAGSVQVKRIFPVPTRSSKIFFLRVNENQG